MENMLEVFTAERKGEYIELDTNFDTIKQHINNKEPVVIRNILSNDEANHLRAFSIKLANRIQPSVPTITEGSPNYHRIDNNPEKSQVKCILHLFAFFYWNSESTPIVNYFKRLFKIRNSLSGLSENYALSGIKDGYISIPLVQQYPRGGGYMQEHQDPDTGQKVVVNTILSKYSKDYKTGGLFYRNQLEEKIFVDSELNPGDVFVFHPTLSHGVDPIDPNEKLDWNKSDGRWMCFSTLVTTSSIHGKGGAGIPVNYSTDR